MVINIIYPDEVKSLTKKVIEYDVLVTNMDRDKGMNVSVFRNCRLSDRFGGSNNSEVMTLTPARKDSAGNYEKGSVVLIECIAGNTDNGMATIIGGINVSAINAYKKDDGQFYEFYFNGLRQKIDKDGAFTLEFNSFVDVDGKKVNEAAAGTKININKDGIIRISDNKGQFFELDRVAKKSTWSDGADSIVIDQGAKSVALTSSGEMTSKSEKKMSMDSSDALSMSSKQDTEIKSGANLQAESKGNMAAKSGGNWEVKATGNVQVQSGGMVMIQGGPTAQLQGAITMLGAGTVPVAAVGVSKVLGIGNLGLPVMSDILTGSATVLVGT